MLDPITLRKRIDQNIIDEIKRAKTEMGEQWEERITDLLGSGNDLHLERLFGSGKDEEEEQQLSKEDIPTSRPQLKKLPPGPEQVGREKPVEEEGEIQVVEEVRRLSVDEAVGVAKTQLPKTFYAQRSSNRPMPTPCSYETCVQSRNTKHTADR